MIVYMRSSYDESQWHEFGKENFFSHLKSKKVKTQPFESLSQKSRPDDVANKQIDTKSTTLSKDEIDNDNEDDDIVENIEYIRNACDHIDWKVFTDDSNVLILTVTEDSSKTICSLSNIEVGVTYRHLCQYGS